MSDSIFITRQECAMRFGLIGAEQIGRWKRKSYPLPKNIRPAIRVGETVYPSRYGERFHSQIATRIQILGEEVEDGFTYTP